MKGEAAGEREQDKVIDAVADAEEVTARGKGLKGPSENNGSVLQAGPGSGPLDCQSNHSL